MVENVLGTTFCKQKILVSVTIVKERVEIHKGPKKHCFAVAFVISGIKTTLVQQKRDVVTVP